ncbi:MAG: hypothetical protein D6731_07065 [Planctomycetota bacterium]|nr:MAG: hypothetical protein D6731_07065 [Planctomycetota bacterium]
MPSPYTRCCAASAALFAALLAGTAAFCVATDPHDVFASLSPRALDEYRNHRSRAAKSARVARGGIDVLLLGTSRVEAGFDPREPAWGEGTVYNAGLGGGNQFETNHALALALSAAPPRRAVIAVDLLGMRAGEEGQRDFARSYFDPRREVVEFWGGHLFGRDALQRGLKVLRRAARGEPGANRPDGFRRPPEQQAAFDHRKLFEGVVRGFLITTYNSAFVYDEERVAHLQRLLGEARAKGVEAVVVVPPVHALLLEAMHVGGVWPLFERHLRSLEAAVEAANRLDAPGPPVALWSFVDYAGACAEEVPPAGSAERMRWWVEGSHFLPALGARIARRLFAGGGSEPGFGQRLGAGRTEAYLAALRERRAVYVREAADEVAWVHRLLRDVAAERAQAERRAQALLRAATRDGWLR